MSKLDDIFRMLKETEIESENVEDFFDSQIEAAAMLLTVIYDLDPDKAKLLTDKLLTDKLHLREHLKSFLEKDEE
jgi:transposase